MASNSSKQFVMKFLDSLPDNISVEEIAYRLYAQEKIKKARESARNGKDYSQEEAEAIIQKWLI